MENQEITGNEEVLETPSDLPAEEPVLEEESGEPEAESEQPEPEKETPAEQDFENIDPNTLPPEIQKFYKGMQGSFTKKMQAVQDVINNLNPHKERLALIDRAIQGDMEAREALARIAGFNQQPPKANPGNEEDLYKDVPPDFEDTKGMVKYLDGRFGGLLKQVIDTIIPQVVQQHMGPVNKLQEEASKAKVRAEIESMKTKYPDLETHAAKMIELKKSNPGLSLEQAYQLATYKKPVAPEKIVSKPGGRATSVVPKGKEPTSFEEAGRMAIAMLKKKG